MFAFFLFLLLTLVFTRGLSGYDSRYNNRKHFILKNQTIAYFLLPRSVGFKRGVPKRSGADFNKMTYAGATFYICKIVWVLLMLVFLFLVPEIKVSPFEFEISDFCIVVDTLNEKLPVLFLYLLSAIEFVVIFIPVFTQKEKPHKKGMLVLSSFLVLLFSLFGMLQIEEIISTIIEVL